MLHLVANRMDRITIERNVNVDGATSNNNDNNNDDDVVGDVAAVAWPNGNGVASLCCRCKPLLSRPMAVPLPAGG